MFGISCKDQKWIEFVEKLDTTFFRHVELNIYDVSKASLIYDKKYLDSLIALGKKKEISFSVHALDGINLGEKIDRIRECSVIILAEALRIAEYIGAKWVTVHLGTAGFSSKDREKKWKRLNLAIQSLNQAIQISSTTKVKLAVENLYQYRSEKAKSKLGDSPEEISYVLSNVCEKERVAFLCDVGHANILTSIETMMNQYCNGLNEAIIAAHVHFNNGVEDTHESLDKYGVKCKPVLSYLYDLYKRGGFLVFESYSLEENMSSRKVVENAFIKFRSA